MILYGSSLSPFVRKVLTYAAEKGIALELKRIALGNRDPDFLETSPFGKIPGFRHPGAGDDGGDYCLSDSTAIISYLEAVQPEPALIPAEAKAKGRVVWWDEFADTILFGCGQRLFFNRVVAPKFLGTPGDEAAADKAEKEELPPLLDYLEGTIPDSLFLVDDRLTLADLAVANPFVNFSHLGIRPDPDRHPRLHSYVESILARPSFATWIESERRFLERFA